MAKPKSAILKLAKESKGRSPKKNMADLLGMLGSTIVPEPDKYYTFIYKAKTPGIIYDSHPLVKVGPIYSWGFIAYNFHWGEARQYSWAEIVSNLYEISEDDMSAVLRCRTVNRKRS